jgi:hypothetical protein
MWIEMHSLIFSGKLKERRRKSLERRKGTENGRGAAFIKTLLLLEFL